MPGSASHYDGWRFQRLDPTWNLSRNLEIGRSYELNSIRFPERDARLNAQVAPLRIGAAANPRLSATTLLQFKSADDRLGVNLRLRYNFREGSDRRVLRVKLTKPLSPGDLMRLAPLVLLSVLAAPALFGQTAAENPRESQLRMLENQRKLLLSMADSMPERLYRDRATPGQRDFAQQIHHAASAAVFIGNGAMGGSRPTLPDTATTFNTRAGLKQYINGAYDHLATLLKNQTAASRGESYTLFGQQMPRWQVWDEIHTHTVWTAGQVVANFRKNGMAPPPFTFF